MPKLWQNLAILCYATESSVGVQSAIYWSYLKTQKQQHLQQIPGYALRLLNCDKTPSHNTKMSKGLQDALSDLLDNWRPNQNTRTSHLTHLSTSSSLLPRPTRDIPWSCRLTGRRGTHGTGLFSTSSLPTGFVWWPNRGLRRLCKLGRC